MIAPGTIGRAVGGSQNKGRGHSEGAERWDSQAGSAKLGLKLMNGVTWWVGVAFEALGLEMN